jgi:hypothetical protein
MLFFCFACAGPASAQIYQPNGKIMTVTDAGGPGVVVRSSSWTCIPVEGSKIQSNLSGTTSQLVSPDWQEVGNVRTEVKITFNEIPDDYGTLVDGLKTKIEFHSFEESKSIKKRKDDLFVSLAWALKDIIHFQLRFEKGGNEGAFSLFHNFERLASGRCTVERGAFSRGKVKPE